MITMLLQIMLFLLIFFVFVPAAIIHAMIVRERVRIGSEVAAPFFAGN